jgi:ribonuclease J
MGMPLTSIENTGADDGSPISESPGVLLPGISGLYESDPRQDLPDGVIISHAHIDHYGLISFIRPELPVYSGAATKHLIEQTALFTGKSYRSPKWISFKHGVSFECGKFSITPYLVDHSAFDAYAFLIEVEDKRIVYTGDFRDHGRKAMALNRLLESIKPGIDALLMEGTVLGRTKEHSIREEELEDQIVAIIQDNPGMTFFQCSGQNIDRLVSFYKASLRLEKHFVIDVYTASILDTVKDYAKIPYPSKHYPNMKVFYPYWLCQRIEKLGRRDILYHYKQFRISREELSRVYPQVTMLVRPSMLSDLKKMSFIKGANYIYSMWQGYLKEHSMQGMLQLITDSQMCFHTVHSSGHGSTATLQKVVDSLKLEKLIPIHTLHPELYKGFGAYTITLKDRETITL